MGLFVDESHDHVTGGRGVDADADPAAAEDVRGVVSELVVIRSSVGLPYRLPLRPSTQGLLCPHQEESPHRNGSMSVLRP
jgi:hypothetical protein